MKVESKALVERAERRAPQGGCPARQLAAIFIGGESHLERFAGFF